MQKVVNITVPENNTFHQFYCITYFGVVFYHPYGLTETVCNCFHTKTLGRTDFESPDWMPKDVTALRKAAKEWKNASTAREQVNLFQQTGVCWSEMWQLPYWDPTHMLVVNLMHCLLEGLAQFQFHKVLKLTSASANAKEIPAQAFSFSFSPPPSADIPQDMTDNEVKQIKEIHTLL